MDKNKLIDGNALEEFWNLSKEWTGSEIAKESEKCVHISGNETISGGKTFTQQISVSGLATNGKTYINSTGSSTTVSGDSVKIGNIEFKQSGITSEVIPSGNVSLGTKTNPLTAVDASTVTANLMILSGESIADTYVRKDEQEVSYNQIVQNLSAESQMLRSEMSSMDQSIRNDHEEDINNVLVQMYSGDSRIEQLLENAKNSLNALIDALSEKHEDDISELRNADDNLKAYAEKLVSDLVNSAPETLDTLKELADALGSDPNFATTISNAIGEKASLADFNAHNADNTRHITASERDAWNAKATQSDFNSHVSEFNSHNADNTRHITSAERTAWNNKSDSDHIHDSRYYTETEVNNLLAGKSNSDHTHDSRYYTETEVNNLLAGKANSSHTHEYIPTSASCNKNWNWSEQGGQPSWLWGGEDGTNMYVYNPSNFSVNYASSANYANSAGYADSAGSASSSGGGAFNISGYNVWIN